ncbi:tRNA 2-thiouridine(34) synthase MnmA [Thermodesulforhabdus norvegica]|uniref:tRNA 2-thiouridine(34) synthase MnmA n=1 Tax=Thermodesulforhabdus norvegica TaxID=39841 RepID=UPI001FE0C985|nr:tRNA 2-thiouridine(34) synthase MnmA [Thermodesulforhabdus norvegica]
MGIALSGGVDSLYAAYCLIEEGHEVVGLHMRIRKDGEDREEEEHLASRARLIGINEVYTVDLQSEFHDRIVRPFVEAYLKGITPNPCVHCNPLIKFGLFAEIGFNLYGIERFATGHYARIVPSPYRNGRFAVARGRDTKKDQSYFLFALSQLQLVRTIFPLGRATKSEAKKWAKEYGFPDLAGKESQEICFLGNRSYVDYIESIGLEKGNEGGPIKDLEGNVLGYHRGIHRFTIGQRRGIGIPSTEPYYVVRLDGATGTVYVGRRKDVYRRDCTVGRVVWGALEEPSEAFKAFVKIRQQHIPAEGNIIPCGQGTVRITFREPQPAITPGQAAVFYDADGVILGGGIIQGGEEDQ